MPFTWPLAATILGVLGLVMFRKPLSQLLDRTEKVKDWLVAPKQAALPAKSETGEVEDQSKVEELTKGFDNQLLRAQEESIRTDLEKFGVKVSTECERILVRHLAGTQIALQFEKITQTIYGSQIQALRWLNGQPNGVRARSLMPFFETGQQRFSALYASYGFQDWVRYLAQRQLITESAESEATPENHEPFGLQITVLGREYLKYLLDRGLPEPSVG